MNNAIYRASLDIHDTNSQELFRFKKGDSARVIHFCLTECGKPYKITDGCTATLRAKKPDGTVLYNTCTVSNDTITYTLTNQTSSAVGISKCEITLYDADKNQITSPRFEILIDDTVYSDNEIESSNEFTELQNALEKVAEKPMKQVYITISNGTATINAKYSNTQNISYRFGKWNANNLPEFISFAFIDNTESSVAATGDAAYHYVTPTDYFAPYNVAALNNRDGDVVTSHNYTGGNHIYQKADGTPILTAKNNYLRFYADGSPLVSGGKYCSKVRIEWSNDVMGWNTVKNDGTGRYILTETISMTFDGDKWEFEKIITAPNEAVRIYNHHGVQFTLKYCDVNSGHAKFLGSESCREPIPTNRKNWSSSHQGLKYTDDGVTYDDSAKVYCDDKFCDTILIQDGVNSVEFGLHPVGLGRYNECLSQRATSHPESTPRTISSAYVSTSKAYFNPVWYQGSDENGIPLGVELSKGASAYMRGFYRFYPTDPSETNESVSVTVNTSGVQRSVGNEGNIQYMTKGGNIYLYFAGNTAYDLPDTVTVTGARADWDKATGKLLLRNPTGDITVSVTGVPVTTTEYTITANLTNLTAAEDNPTTVSSGGTAELLFTAPDGYVLPDTVTVAGAMQEWTKSEGKLTISNPTDDVVVTASGVAEYAITASLTDIDANIHNATAIPAGGSVELTFTSPSGYRLPDAEDWVVVGASSVWSPITGTLTLSNPTGNVTVTASGVEGEIWEIIENPTSNMMPDLKILEKVNYTAKDEAYARFFCQTSIAGATNLKMYNTSGEEGELKYSCGKDGVGTWSDEGYRTIKIANASTNENLLTWLTANATKL